MGSKLIVASVALEVSFVTACVVAGFAPQRRPHFWRDVLARSLTVPALVLLVAFVTPGHLALELAWVTLVASMLVFSTLACLSLDPPRGPSDEGGGGGSGPDRPSGLPEPPHGGIGRWSAAPDGGAFALPDADPSRVRVRDHSSPSHPPLKRSRDREPAPGPAPAPVA